MKPIKLKTCARCGRSYGDFTIRRCHHPQINKTLGEYICYYCCRKCKFHTQHPLCGAIGCGYTEKSSNGNIATYESARIAQEKTGTRYQDISACIHGRQKTAHGYRWGFVEEVENECMIPK